jgi:hypothetical protein
MCNLCFTVSHSLKFPVRTDNLKTHRDSILNSFYTYHRYFYYIYSGVSFNGVTLCLKTSGNIVSTYHFEYTTDSAALYL